MSNSKNRKNLIDLIGVTSPLSILSSGEIEKRNAKRVTNASSQAFFGAQIENLIKLSERDLEETDKAEADAGEEPKVEAEPEAVSEPETVAEEKVLDEGTKEPETILESKPKVVSEVEEPVEDSEESAIREALKVEEALNEPNSELKASDIEVRDWYDLAETEVIAPSDWEPSDWYEQAAIWNKKGRGFRTLAEENAAMPNWEKRKLSRITFDQNLVDNDIILSVRHLKKFFTIGSGIIKDKLKAVHDVSFDVKKGEVFGLVGESGCGKTTTGRTIMRLHEPTSGSVYFMGYRIGAGDRWNDKEIKWKRKRGKKTLAKLKSDRKAEIREAGSDSEKVAEVKQAYDETIAKTRVEIKKTIKEQRQKIRHIHYDEKHVDKHLLTKMQMIFQDPIDSLDPRMTVQDIIQEGLKIQKYSKRETQRLNLQHDEDLERLRASDLPQSIKDDKERFLDEYYRARIEKAHDYKAMVADALNKVGLIPDYANRYPHEFSGGQRQRIGIARALIMNPELIIADEPISALDVSIRAQIINLLNDLRDEMGLTIVFIAHDLSVVKYFCERIAVMYYGNMVELATSDELFKHPLHPYTKSLLSAIPKPDPLSEKTRVRIRYNPSEDHDYSRQEPWLQEIVPGHFVLANDAEMEKYRAEIVADDEALAEKEREEAEAAASK